MPDDSDDEPEDTDDEHDAEAPPGAAREAYDEADERDLGEHGPLHELMRKSRHLDPGLRVRAGIGVLRVVWNGVFLPPAANLDARCFISLPAGGPGHAGSAGPPPLAGLVFETQ